LPAVGGAIIGGLIDGKKGAAIGAGVGGGAGTAVVLTTRGKEVRLGRGAVVSIRLTARSRCEAKSYFTRADWAASATDAKLAARRCSPSLCNSQPDSRTERTRAIHFATGQVRRRDLGRRPLLLDPLLDDRHLVERVGPVRRGSGPFPGP
jgi:hypothetical protein